VSSFTDLPLVSDEAEARRVHRTDGLYLVKRGGTAHASPYDCIHLEPSQTVDNSQWRVATTAECRALRFAWCQSCS
jgi:hypothetical protein